MKIEKLFENFRRFVKEDDFQQEKSDDENDIEDKPNNDNKVDTEKTFANQILYNKRPESHELQHLSQNSKKIDVSVVFRGSRMTKEQLTNLLGKEPGPYGEINDYIISRVPKGSSWSKHKMYAEAFALSRPLDYAVLWGASTSENKFIDLEDAYKSDKIKHMKMEREVINVDEKVICNYLKWADVHNFDKFEE